ncbi:Cytidine deaminase 6 [Cardamine amara subsp. amara]|uniref:Cytidine deaminase 6 n=1 Tax=Cardamine amara subsp. amara TaxID=228776 RepID=A0ABD1AV58_CARAN
MAQPSSFVLTRAKAEVPIDLDPKNLRSYIDRKVSLGLAPNSAGAVGMGASEGVLYLGVNVVLPGLPYNLSIHAVQFLIANLALNSERELHYLAVSSDGSICRPPCDLCRRFLHELRAPDKFNILIENKDENKHLMSLESLMILQGPKNLIPEEYYRLLKWRHNGLTLLNPHSDKEICADSDYDHQHHCTNLKCMGLVAANKSYAPYSECPSGVALRDSDNKVYVGWYMESVTYNILVMHNPSLGPLQAALVDFVTRTRGKEFKKIVEVVLVEKKDAKVRQEDTVRMILKKIAHRYYDFKVIHCSEPA